MNPIRPKRGYIALTAIVIAMLFLLLMHFVLSDSLAQLLLDKGSKGLPYPVTIQNIMWLMFFLGLGELYFRYQESRISISHLQRSYLPVDDLVVLQPKDMGPIFKSVKEEAKDESAFLPRLIHQAVMQFQSSRSVEQATMMVNSQLELFSHQLDLKYSMLRYVSWLLPTLGFIGTVYGIAITLAVAGSANPEDPALLGNLTKSLAVAFNTTLLALLQSAFIVYLMHLTQGREEQALNTSGQHCLNNLINRLYVRQA
jgi:biopolymer transport protein ExbB/TolQ